MLLYAPVGVLLLAVILPHVLAKEDLKQAESCGELYKKGIAAYLENNFKDCVTHLETSIKVYKSYSKALLNCRLQCSEEAAASDPLYPVDVDNLYFYEKTVKFTLCLIKCRQLQGELTDTYNLSQDTENIFEDKTPYEYLHLCYFQTKKYQKAASAAFTYLVSHPKHETMIKNLKYYTALPEVKSEEVVNFEAMDYVYLYMHGVDAYEKKEWKAVEGYMEESLSSYIQSEEECRAQCEGPLDQGWYPDFLPAIANHFTYALTCKRRCRIKLNNLNGEYREDFLASHFHYLQYAYFKGGNLKAACEAAATYVVFFPEDETMRENIEYYRKLPKVENSYFTPRPDMVHYVRRYTYETRLMDYIKKEYTFKTTTKAPDKETPVKERDVSNAQNITLIMDENDLNGTQRVVLDGLANENQCNELLKVAQLYAQPGDGYKGKKSPHTNMERFEGLSINTAVLLVNSGILDQQALYLYLKITEDAKFQLIKQFNLKKKLYFNFTHLVCRTSMIDAPLNRTDYSHTIHADNCNLKENGFCEKLPPAFTWRDYSAIVYLNRNFQGGEFIFSEDINGTHIQSSIKPKCGRMVGFSAGPENLHGVRAVKQGTRCALALWFTFSQKYEETSRVLAYKLIGQV